MAMAAEAEAEVEAEAEAEAEVWSISHTSCSRALPSRTRYTSGCTRTIWCDVAGGGDVRQYGSGDVVYVRGSERVKDGSIRKSGVEE